MTQRTFSLLHARVFCHATEEPSKVEASMRNAVGPLEIDTTRAEGTHGNPIFIMEGVLDREKDVVGFFSRLGRESLLEIASSADKRIDDACNMFIRLDKQAAFGGEVRLSHDEDVIAVRIRIRAFPANRQVAVGMLRDFVSQLMQT